MSTKAPKPIELAPEQKERFLSLIDKSAGLDRCWPWTGGIHTNTSYGYFGDGQKRRFAHRIAFFLEHGPILPGLHICHSCDNPPCCNPAHLFLGTHQDNMRDMLDKGRNPYFCNRGASHPNSRFTNEQVREIRTRHAAGETQMSLCRHFNVCSITMSRLVRGERYENAGGPLRGRDYTGQTQFGSHKGIRRTK